MCLQSQDECSALGIWLTNMALPTLMDGILCGPTTSKKHTARESSDAMKRFTTIGLTLRMRLTCFFPIGRDHAPGFFRFTSSARPLVEESLAQRAQITAEPVAPPER